MALLRQVLVAGFLSKDIETYGIVKITKKGQAFIKNPESFMMSEDHEYNEKEDETIVTAAKSSGIADEVLMTMLKDLRKKVSKKLNVKLGRLQDTAKIVGVWIWNMKKFC